MLIYNVNAGWYLYFAPDGQVYVIDATGRPRRITPKGGAQ